MPVYCYEDDDGDLVERVFRVGCAPRRIEINGRLYHRIVESVSVPSSRGWPMVCKASGVSPEDASKLRDYLKRRGVPTEVSSDGDPIYTSANHRKAALKARGLHDNNSYV